MTSLRSELATTIAALELLSERLGRIKYGEQRDVITSALTTLLRERLRLAGMESELEAMTMIPLSTLH
jgi:hypothetical protein